MNRGGLSAYVMRPNQLAKAQSALAAAEVKLSTPSIKAPADGTLLSRTVERGNVVQAGDTLMTLSPKGETRLVLDIDEKNLASLQLGQTALASADAYPDQSFPAELVYINPSVDPAQGSVTVKLRIPDPPAYLVQDMTVSVDIEVARRANALIVPLTAVHDTLTGAPWVWLVMDSHVTKRPIKLGARGDARAEVLDGLRDRDLIVSAGTLILSDGQRAKPVAP